MARIDFDIEKAKNGAKLVTRGGYEARIVCYNKLGSLPLIVLVTIPDAHGYSEIIILMNDKGKVSDNYDASPDLFIEVPDRWCIVVTDNNGVEAIFPGIIYYDYEHVNRVFQTIQHKKKRIVKLIEA